MAVGTVNLIQENTQSGGLNTVERTVIFIGSGGASAQADVLHALNQQTDLGALLGAEASALKTNIEATRLNAGPNFTGWAIALDSLSWDQAIEFALDAPNDIYPEIVALTDPLADAAQVDAMQAAAVAAQNVFGKYITIHCAVAGIDAATQTWAQYLTATKPLQDGKAADCVALVPQLHGNNLGVVIGRLINDSYSLGDSPMRVRSGAVMGLGAAPVDSGDSALTMAHLVELATARFSVPQWYTNFDGMYWADHALLDVEGGDYQVYENRRVMDYISRRIRVLMIGKIADRSLNSSASSMAFHEQVFMKPIFDAAKGSTVNGEPKPGLVKTPLQGDIQINWINRTQVELVILAAPVDAPKKISARIALDLNRLG